MSIEQTTLTDRQLFGFKTESTVTHHSTRLLVYIVFSQCEFIYYLPMQFFALPLCYWDIFSHYCLV